MSKGYSKVAIDFQRSIRRAAIFRVHDYPEHLSNRGQTLALRKTILTPDNPDDHLYELENDKGECHQIRGWWLRRNCERVD